MIADRPNRRSRGFILLEALVAIAILGPAVGIFLTVAANTATRSVATDEEVAMLSRARDALSLAVVSWDGSIGIRESADGPFRWTTEFSLPPGLGSAKIETLLPVRVAVTMHREGRRDQRLATMILAPISP